jgi:DNA helicase II / ATP-dependent DNA helicase PcrA
VSRFVDEIPADAVRWLTPRLRGGAMADVAWDPAPAKPAAQRAPDHGFRIGQAVMHPKFGHGVIVSAEGSGTDARLQVNFGRQGMKWLALEYARLTPA